MFILPRARARRPLALGAGFDVEPPVPVPAPPVLVESPPPPAVPFDPPPKMPTPCAEPEVGPLEPHDCDEPDWVDDCVPSLVTHGLPSLSVPPGSQTRPLGSEW